MSQRHTVLRLQVLDCYASTALSSASCSRLGVLYSRGMTNPAVRSREQADRS